MRERQLIAGLDRFDKKRDNGHGIAYPTLPLNIGKVHAIQDFRWYRVEYRLALCGAKVKVVLPKTFDPGDPDVCPGCAVAGYSKT